MLDSDIIALYWARDEKAIAETNDKYGSYCLTIAHNILSRHEDAEEAVSDTWLKTWDSIPPKCPEYLRLFVGRITRNLAINRLRKTKRYNDELTGILEELQECVEGSKSAESDVMYQAFSDEITRLIHQLPSREKAVFLQRYYYAESASTIAQKCHITVDNVYVILGRARKRIRAKLIQDGWMNG